MANEIRLIDANDLKKKISANFEQCFYSPFCEIQIAEETIDDAPTVDAVEVVRCKDCKKWGGVIYGGRCKQWSAPMSGITHFTSADDFCSYGERKDNE